MFIWSLPLFIVVRGVFHAFSVKLFNHFVKLAFPKLLEPACVSEPLYKCWTDCIVCTNKGSAVPCGCKGVVTVSAECPYFGTVVGAVYGGGYITAAVAGGLKEV